MNGNAGDSRLAVRAEQIDLVAVVGERAEQSVGRALDAALIGVRSRDEKELHGIEASENGSSRGWAGRGAGWLRLSSRLTMSNWGGRLTSSSCAGRRSRRSVERAGGGRR